MVVAPLCIRFCLCFVNFGAQSKELEALEEQPAEEAEEEQVGYLTMKCVSGSVGDFVIEVVLPTLP